MSKKKAKKGKASVPVGDKLLKVAALRTGWVKTAPLIKAAGCTARTARRTLRKLVKSRKLKAHKAGQYQFFALPSMKKAAPEAATKSASTGKRAKRTRTRSAKKKVAAKSGRKSKERTVVVERIRKGRGKSGPVLVRTVTPLRDAGKKQKAEAKKDRATVTPAKPPVNTPTDAEVLQAAGQAQQQGDAATNALLA